MLGPSPALCQQATKGNNNIKIDDNKIKLDKQIAVSSLLRLADELKSEEDKPAAALLQAEIADVLWKTDEQASRAIFQQAFNSVSQPSSTETSGAIETAAQRSAALRRRASALTEVLHRLSLHDRKSAEALREKLAQETPVPNRPAGSVGPQRAELLAQVALTLADSEPAQAQKMGGLALSSGTIPQAAGPLLFALSRKDRNLSNLLFRASVAALRRNGLDYHPVMINLANYSFDWRGQRRSDTEAADARALIELFVDAASAKTAQWRQAALSGPQPVSDLETSLLGFLSSRAIPIIQLNAPDKVRVVEQLLGEMSSSLSQQQQQRIAALQSVRQQSDGLLGGMEQDYQSQLDLAEKERDPWVRDSLLRSLALSLMLTDTERALAAAAKISDAAIRSQTEDDVNLFLLSTRARDSAEEAHATALKFNDKILQARVLVELGSRAATASKDPAQAIALFSEAHDIALKGDDTPDKVTVILNIAEQFARFDPARGQRMLSDTIKVINKLRPDTAQPETSVRQPPIRIKTITAFNGKELTTGERETVESINFKQLGAFARQDYMGTRYLGERIDNKILRAKFFIAVDSNILQRADREAATTRSTPQPIPVRP
ncbi:MAG TPA: hypothetical protein VF723_14015 [Pyrinomonadaceae bacterium]